MVCFQYKIPKSYFDMRVFYLRGSVSEHFPIVGKAIYPQDLPRVLGLGFTSLPQMSLDMEVNPDEARRLIKEMVEEGEFEPWVAAKCDWCGFIWPLCPRDSITQDNKEVICPLCNEHHFMSEMLYYNVYKVMEYYDHLS